MYLARVIAHLTKTTGKDLDGVFQQKVCRPLNIDHAYFGMNEYVTKHLARGHNGNRIDEDLDFIREFNSAGGLCTEAMSYAKFLIAIMNDKGLKQESMKEMLKTQLQIPDDDNLNKYFGATGISLGFDKKPSAYGENYIHGGNNRGFSSYTIFNKDKKFGFVFFTNSNSCSFPGCPELWQKMEPFLLDGEI